MENIDFDKEVEKAIKVHIERKDYYIPAIIAESMAECFRDGIEWVLTYLSVMPFDEAIELIRQRTPKEATCRVCGCTEDHACYAPGHGSCWWADEEKTICSHCYDDEIFKLTTHNIVKNEDTRSN